MVLRYIAFFVTVAMLSSSLPALAAECTGSTAEIALHLTSPTTKIPCGQAPLSCSIGGSDIVTTGDLDQEYRVYVLLTNLESGSSFLQVQIGIDYDAVVGSGVDVLEFQSCATTTTAIGNWPEPGSELAMTYASCQTTSGADPVVLGWFRVTAHTQGRFSLRPVNFGLQGTVPRLVDCDLNETLIHPQNVGEIALGGPGGFDPCTDFLDTFSGACCWPDSCHNDADLACCWANHGSFLGAFTNCADCNTRALPKTWGQIKSRYE